MRPCSFSPRFWAAARGIFFYCNGDVPGFGFFNDKATPPEVREKLTAFFRLVNTHQKEFSLPRAQADIAVLLSNAASLHYGSDAGPGEARRIHPAGFADL